MPTEAVIMTYGCVPECFVHNPEAQMEDHQIPEKKLWRAVVLMFLKDLQEAADGVDEADSFDDMGFKDEKLKDRIRRLRTNHISELDVLLDHVRSDWFGWICENSDIDHEFLIQRSESIISGEMRIPRINRQFGG